MQALAGFSSSTSSLAFPWRETTKRSEHNDDGDTAPSGGNIATASGGGRHEKRRSDAELSAQYGKLRESGLPLDTMKLVSNEDLSALNEDAGQLLTLNERLGRYALYVANLERSNKELGVKVESLIVESAGLKVEHEEKRAAWAEEKRALMEQVAALEMRVSESELRIEQAEGRNKKLAEEQKQLQEQRQALSQECKGLTQKMAQASEEYRSILRVRSVTSSVLAALHLIRHPLTPLPSSSTLLTPSAPPALLPPSPSAHPLYSTGAQHPAARPPHTLRPQRLRQARGIRSHTRRRRGADA